MENKNNNLAILKKSKRIFMRMIPFVPIPELMELFENLDRSNSEIDGKISNAYNSLKETSDLINELEIELSSRTENILKLKEEYEKYKGLSEIKKDEAKAIILQLEQSIGKNRNKELLRNFTISIISGLIIFVLGIWLSPYIQSFLGIASTK